MAIILVVEDVPNICTVMKINLEKRHHEVVTRSSAEAAEIWLKTNQPDVLVVDIVLDGQMSGIDLLNNLSQTTNGRSLPVIVATATDRYQHLNLPTNMNIQRINKPFSIDKLLGAVKQALGG